MADYRPTRRQRQKSAETTVFAAGGAGVVAAVCFLLALVTSFSWLWFFVFAVVAGVLAMRFKSSI